MQVSGLRAEADPRGGRIDLAWTNPAASEFPTLRGVKILRRESSFPDEREVREQRGVYFNPRAVAGEAEGFSDTGLKTETTYYYAVVAFDESGPAGVFPAYVSAMTTAPYGSAERMYELLPALYRRLDTVRPPDAPGLDPEERDRGQLRRLLELFGTQLDLLRSRAAASRDFSDLSRVDGALLPLLAAWLGWPSDYSLPLDKRRNEIRYAPHFYRTTGIAANLRATLNRLTTWDVRVKEFVHNVFLSNDPEQLSIWEAALSGDTLDTPAPVTLDAAYEGRPAFAADAAEGRQWLFYHARHDAPPAREGEAGARASFHLWCKQRDGGEWLPASRLTPRDGVNRHPAVVRRKSDGAFLVFHSRLEHGADAASTRINLLTAATGRAARAARLAGTKREPFALSPDDRLEVAFDDGRISYSKTVIFRKEEFRDLSQATAEEVAALLNRELAGVEATAEADGTVALTSLAQGAAASVAVKGGTASARLGLSGSQSGAEAEAARLSGLRDEPFALADGDTLTLKADGALPTTITFGEQSFSNIGSAKASEVAAAINRFAPGLARAVNKRVVLTSRTAGGASLLVVDVDASKAAPALGFGVPLPPAPAPAAETEPAAFEDEGGGVWLFWSSRREGGRPKLWYNRFDADRWLWQGQRRLTSGAEADRQPAVVYDASAGGSIWVFWARGKEDGRRNIFYRTAPSAKSFDVLQDADWTERELGPDPKGRYDNQEPSPLLKDAGHVELFFSSDRTNGTHLWSCVVTPGGEEAAVRLSDGQFTHRAPAAVRLDARSTRLFFRCNQSREYESRLYPAARTVDARYSGSTLLDTGNRAKLRLRRQFDDALRYTYDTRKGDEHWYARDTVGVYLTPDTADETLIVRKRAQIESVLRSYLPIQVRAVLIIQQVFLEFVYTYDRPEARPPRLIGERAYDTVLGEVYRGFADRYAARADFRWARTWQKAGGGAGKTLPDLSARPPDVSLRLPLRGVEEGE